MTIPESSHGVNGQPENSASDAKNQHWKKVSRSAPCPICKKESWCQVTDDNVLCMCRHESSGAFRTDTDKHGAPYHIHRLKEPTDESVTVARPPDGSIEPADVETRDKVYSALLGAMSISPSHLDHLTKRGLDHAEIGKRQYRTLEPKTQPKLANALRKKFSTSVLLSVPGFFVKNARLSIGAANGLFIPIRDAAGRIVSLNVRPDNPLNKDDKYLYVSSAKHGGPGPGSHPHVPLGIVGPADVVRITEGALKADVSTALSGLPTIGASGATNWRPCLPVLKALGCKTVRLAFDADAWTNQNVGRALCECSNALRADGFAVEIERWESTAGKGIDDVLAAGGTIHVLAGDDAAKAVAEAVKRLDEHIVIPPGSTEFSPARPLVIQLRPVPTFDPDLLPEPLKLWCTDIAGRKQSPIEYVAVSAIVALSGVVGRKMCIRPKKFDNWIVVPNLWGMPVGRPGMLKTPSMQDALRPTKKLEFKSTLDSILTHEHDRRTRLIALARLEAARNALNKAAKSKDPDGSLMFRLAGDIGAAEDALAPPGQRRIIVNDATIEKLQELHKENPNGLLYYCDEINALFKSFQKRGRESDRSFLLQAWDGNQDHVTDRIGRGTVAGQRLCLAMLGSIQPGPLAQTIRDTINKITNDDGLISRFQLLVYPDPIAGFSIVDRPPDERAATQVEAVFAGIDGLDPEVIGATRDLVHDLFYMQFTDEAQAYFYNWLTNLETTKLRSNEPGMLESHFSKYRSLMPSLALIFHLVDMIYNGEDAFGPVSLESAERAARWCDLLEQHARRVYGIATESDIGPASVLGSKLGSLSSPFTRRNIKQKGWGGLKYDMEIDLAIGVLEDHGWINSVEVEPTERGGRRTTKHYINPEYKKYARP